MVEPRSEEVVLMVPSPGQECSEVEVEVPGVECQQVEEDQCVVLPSLQPGTVETQQCTVGLAEPDCNSVQLTLPVQVTSFLARPKLLSLWFFH